MSKIDLDAVTIAYALDQTGEDSDDVRTAYSGRGMYGRSCLGYTGAFPHSFAFWLAVGIARSQTGIEEPESYDVGKALTDMREPSVDSMGTGTIYYWPNITVTGTLSDD